MCHLIPHTTHPIRCENTTTVSETAPTIVMGSTKSQSSKVKPVNGSEPSRATRVMDEATQRMTNILARLVPDRGDPMSSSFVLSLDREVCGLTSNHFGFSTWITRERSVKSSSPDLIGGGGALAPV
jgi:hypothetical protein